MLTTCRRVFASLAIGWAATLSLCSLPAMAQVDWLTTLNATQVPVALTQQTVADSGDGAVYVAAIANDGESSRVRLARISSTGVEQWSRWVTGSYVASRVPLFVHPDSSATLVYQSSSSVFCLQNFSATGDSRFSRCFSSVVAKSRVLLAADGELYVALAAISRTFKKLSPTGVERWSRVDPIVLSGNLSGNGVDSAGNYFEIQDSRLRSWSSVDGSLVGDAVLYGFNWVANSPTGKDAIARASRDVVLITGAAAPGNAMVVSVSRYAASGAAAWTRQLIFPGAANNEFISLAPAEGDAVYVVRTPYVDGDTQIVKLSATGTVLWQKHYAGIRRVIEGGAGLLALRSITSASPASSDSFVFSLAAGDGTLGIPVIYSRSDSFVPSDWFAVNGGVVATFQGSNPLAPVANFPASVAASTVFLGATPSNRWLLLAQTRTVASVSQSDCLMPRLAQSNPSSWWGRTQSVATGAGASDWTTVTGATGGVAARTAQSALGCGAPISADGGRTVVSANLMDRVKKVSATGAAVWQTSSTLTAATAGNQPLQVLSASGDMTYMSGSVMGRVSATGVLLFEVETFKISARFLAVDSANNVWLVSGSNASSLIVTKVSAAGAVLWSSTIMTPACAEANLAARLLPSNEMLLATQSCTQPSVYKVNAAGQIAWQRFFSGTTARPSMFFSALQVDAAGNIYAGGCLSSGTRASTGSNGMSVLMSLTAAGADRWMVQSDLIADASECITSIAMDGTDTVYAAASSSDPTKRPVLWSLTGAGVERWRHSGVLNLPVAASTELAAESTGRLIALGEAPPGISGARETSIRRINVASIGASGLALKFLEVPSAFVPYREQFPVRIGLRTAADVASIATAPVVVGLARQSGGGTLDGPRSCTIAIGSSECVISDNRYDRVEPGVTLAAGADGFLSVVSPAIGFTFATTSTSLSTLTAGPLTAYSVIRVRAAVQAPPPAIAGSAGTINGPRTPSNSALTNCASGFDAGAITFTECDLLLRAANLPLSASFTPSQNDYLPSTAVQTSFAFTKVAPTLLITNDPANTYVVGDRVRFRVALVVPGGVNASTLIALNTITLSGGGVCASSVSSGAVFNGFAGSYVLCEITQPASGLLTVNFNFAGDVDLLPSGPVAYSVTIVSGGVLRGTGTTFPSGISLCSTTPGVTCGFVDGYSQWQCTGPSGMSGQVYFVAVPGAGQYHFPGSPVSFSNVTGLTNTTAPIPFNTSSLACQLDVDGDGARMTLTDGILILRRTLGLTGDALTDGVTHACVPRTAVAISQAISLPAYDIDGDGFTLPHTDGLLLLRAMLGLRGEALISGAVAQNALRKTALEIQNFLTQSCGHSFN